MPSSGVPVIVRVGVRIAVRVADVVRIRVHTFVRVGPGTGLMHDAFSATAEHLVVSTTN